MKGPLAGAAEHNHMVPMPSPSSATSPIGPSFSFGGHSFIALADRALFWPKHRALIVADLHFEKGSAYAALGQHLPPYDSADTLDRLDALAALTDAQQIFCLGDSFHDVRAAERMDAGVSQVLRRLAETRRVMWIAGNHDGLSGGAWGGNVIDEMLIDGILLRHESLPHEHRPEISGHYHPKLRLHARGRLLSRPCFVGGQQRLVLPAFGSLTGGLDVRGSEIAGIFRGQDYAAYLVAAGEWRRFPLEAMGRRIVKRAR